MASHQQSRIQFYLEKNKIGPLFEELLMYITLKTEKGKVWHTREGSVVQQIWPGPALWREMMTKLITETPDHPIPFLISHLQTKHSGSCKLHRTLSGSAALWAETGPAETKGTRRDYRSYEKPWQMHPKKPKKSKSDLAVSNISPPSPESKSLPRSIEHTSWEWRGHPENRDFDELNHILQESRKLGKALENLSRSKTSECRITIAEVCSALTLQSIAVSDEIDQDHEAYSSSLMRPRVVGEWVGREEEDADPLAAEMLQPPVPRTKTEGWDCEESSPARRLKVELRTKGLKQQQQHHKKLLAAMLSQDSFDSTSGSATSIAEEDIDDEDDAMELLALVVTALPQRSWSNGWIDVLLRCCRVQGEKSHEESPEGGGAARGTVRRALAFLGKQICLRLPVRQDHSCFPERADAGEADTIYGVPRQSVAE
ncbi:hypothetical protein Z043_110831 [Scleropages formosus]|uniref:Uncharacterized protein n=1 Tax=Scleropages formosus TaxID=113540 RepID=A0A0N8JZU9_SCLFO|nr:hypothetical protein Z043_110831 [Scleropages formosus]